MTTARIHIPTARPMPRPRIGPRSREAREIAFVLAHVPLAAAIRVFPAFSLLHALGVVVLGLSWSRSRNTAHRTLMCAAYVAGAEVLWRMTGGNIVYEYGKYACALLLLAAYPRLSGWRRGNQLAVLFFVLLIPSIVGTLDAFGASAEARRQVSFNLSGPFCLAVAAYVFTGCRSAYLDLRGMLVSLMAPMLGISAVVARSVLTADTIRFGTESNFVTSGGFGPNQVSAVLGLGAVISLFLALSTRATIWRFAYFGLTMLFMVQALLTFSRGGVINALVCAALLGVHYLHNRRTRVVLMVALVLFGILGSQVVLPALDRFTGGMLSERFGELDPSLRREIAEHELQIFRDNPVLGVGPGVAKEFRRSVFHTPVAAHTEYTRLLAEHGVFGALAALILLVLAARAYLQAPTALTKAWVATMVAWSMLEMAHAAMRIALISFLFGLALIRWYRPPPKARTRPRPAVGPR